MTQHLSFNYLLQTLKAKILLLSLNGGGWIVWVSIYTGRFYSGSPAHIPRKVLVEVTCRGYVFCIQNLHQTLISSSGIRTLYHKSSTVWTELDLYLVPMWATGFLPDFLGGLDHRMWAKTCELRPPAKAKFTMSYLCYVCSF